MSDHPDYRRRDIASQLYTARKARTAGRNYRSAVTPQQRNGFVVRGILRDDIRDDELGHDATVIVWDNPDYNRVRHN